MRKYEKEWGDLKIVDKNVLSNEMQAFEEKRKIFTKGEEKGSSRRKRKITEGEGSSCRSRGMIMKEDGQAVL